MNIIITGASGAIGRSLVPYLVDAEHELLLVGRNAEALQQRFPNQRVCSYDDLASYGEGYDACVHLAVLNNSEDGDLALFRAANVDLLKVVFQNIKTAGCNHFINITTTHSADSSRKDSYSISKHEADIWLSQQKCLDITVIRLPAVFSKYVRGHLSNVMSLPKPLRSIAIILVGALKPIVHVNRVCDEINASLKKKYTEEIYITNPQEQNIIFSLFKKAVDWLFALTVILLTSWLFIIVYFLITSTSAGPAIFAQSRVGKGGKIFTCYKFRTMALGTKQVGTHDLNEHAVTSVGKFLRKSKIDEFPQVINILRGEMSLVGPRPCLPIQSELIEERSRRGVIDMVPGITGWSQINDIDMSDPVKLAKADYDYMVRRSIPFELSIIFKTFFGAGRGDRIRH